MASISEYLAARNQVLYEVQRLGGLAAELFAAGQSLAQNWKEFVRYPGMRHAPWPDSGTVNEVIDAASRAWQTANLKWNELSPAEKRSVWGSRPETCL